MSFLPPLPPPLHPAFDLLHVMTILQLPRQCRDVEALPAGKHRDVPDRRVLPSPLSCPPHRYIQGAGKSPPSRMLAKPQPAGGSRRALGSHQRGAPVQISLFKEMTCSRLWLASKRNASPCIACCLKLSGCVVCFPLARQRHLRSPQPLKLSPSSLLVYIFFLWALGLK